MSIDLAKNQSTLISIIYARDSFTAPEIVSAYQKVRHSNIVDVSTTVEEHLDLLVEFGAIRQSRGRYIVRSQGVPIEPVHCSCVD